MQCLCKFLAPKRLSYLSGQINVVNHRLRLDVLSWMQVYLQENADDSAAVATFKRSITDSLQQRFTMTSLAMAKHPFIVTTVLDPAMKAMINFPDTIHTAAYEHVHSLVTNVRLTIGVDRDVDKVEEPLTKRAKQDVRSATMSFLARRVETTQASPTAEFDRYLSAVSTPGCNLLSCWKEHTDVYPNCTAIAHRYHAIPASSAASKRLFSTTGQLVDKRRSRLLPECVESLVFLNHNK